MAGQENVQQGDFGAATWCALLESLQPLPAPYCPCQELGARPKSMLPGPRGFLQPKAQHPTQVRDRPMAVPGLSLDGLCPPKVRTIPPSPPSSSSPPPPWPAAHEPWGIWCPLTPTVPLIPGTAAARPTGGLERWGGPNMGTGMPLVCVYMFVRVEHTRYQGQTPPSPRSPCHLCCALRAKAQQSWVELVWTNPRC